MDRETAAELAKCFRQRHNSFKELKRTNPAKAKLEAQKFLKEIEKNINADTFTGCRAKQTGNGF